MNCTEKTQIRKRIVYNEILIDDNYDWIKFFKENKEAPIIFHGTSSNCLDSILKYGLDIEKHPISEDDNRLFEKLLDDYGGLVNYNWHSEHESVCLTFSHYCAKNHAETGPEAVDRLLKELEFYKMKGISDERIDGLYKKYSEFKKSHKPTILYIKPKITDLDFNFPNDGEYLKIFSDKEKFEKFLDIANFNCPSPSVSISELRQQGFDPHFWGLRHNCANLSPSDLIQYYVRSMNYAAYMKNVPLERIVGYEIISPSKLQKKI